jgi:hypothetical protein
LVAFQHSSFNSVKNPDANVLLCEVTKDTAVLIPVFHFHQHFEALSSSKFKKFSSYLTENTEFAIA